MPIPSPPPAISDANPVLIIGAGIVGLTLSHALARSRIPHRVYDRDTHLTSRGPGWAVSIHWARPALAHCLTPSDMARVEAAQVCPGTNDIGRFLFLDLDSAVPVYEIPSAPLLRLNRGRFRDVLASGGGGAVNVRWGKQFEDWRVVGDEDEDEEEVEVEVGGVDEKGEVKGVAAKKSKGEGVKVCFADGECVTGALLVGADGANSRVRQMLCGEAAQLQRLPIRMLGTTVRLTEAEFAPLRRIHPMLFQGCHPRTGTFMWFSIISVPETNGSVDSPCPFYEGQVNLSWRVEHEDEELPASNADRLEMMKRLAAPFEERLKTLVENLSDENSVAEIRLLDWPVVEWPNHGRVTLIGDAAHAMTMYRGEACNHGIVDAQMLHDTILSIYEGRVSQAAALDEFDKQVSERTREGVLLSRRACLDAHDIHALKSDSPLVSKRALIRTPGMDLSKRS